MNGSCSKRFRQQSGYPKFKKMKKEALNGTAKTLSDNVIIKLKWKDWHKKKI